MAEITYKSFKDWGMDMFCIQDYNEYLIEKAPEVFDGVSENEMLAGMVIFDEDTFETITSFIDMAYACCAFIIMIDFSNLSDTIHDGDVEFLQSIYDYITTKYGDTFVDLHSYENRFAFGARVTE